VHIDELLAVCPKYSRVRFYVHSPQEALFAYGSSGDALELIEIGERGPTGNRITALILECETSPRSDARGLRGKEHSP
jgi:hypothetical protein